MTDPSTNPVFSEVFCSELPSPCNLYMSGKQASRRRPCVPSHRNPKGRKKTSAPIVRFATERHSLSLLRKNDLDSSGSNRERGGDDYSLSLAYLPSSSSAPGEEDQGKSKAASTKKSTDAKIGLEETADICLAHSSMFWENLPGAYQGVFEVVNCGKTIALSKRRIQFKFGYIHGSEHELIVAWSFSSGKHTISMDGNVIFCSDGDSYPSKIKLQYCWQDEFGHTLQVTAHAAPGLKADWRQYDLLIDGISFFQLPKISELGDNDRQPCQYPESSLEVFAMAKNPITENNDTKEHKSSDNNSLTTHESHSLSDGGKDGGEIVDQKSAEAIGSSTSNEAGGNARKNDKHSSSPNHFLIVKSRVLLGEKIDGVLESGADKSTKRSRMRSSAVTIPLDFRPMSVHATELHITTDTNMNDINSRSSCSAIGVFVASVDDNKLRLYVSTKETLQRTSTERNTRQPPNFVSVPLYGSSVSEVNADESMKDSFIFSTTIMAIDTTVTDEQFSEMLHDGQGKLNCLAVACYDGTVRIYTYKLKGAQKTNSNGNISAFQFHHLRWSAFIVDGPVVSLHFGKEIPRQQTPSLFLIAGSLCGFACLFYESSLPPANDSPEIESTNFFDGPLTIVDGLYDARQEGYEDCVTAVHVVHVCSGDGYQIVVGTQGGRLLLFQQCPTQNVSEDQVISAQLAKEKVAYQIDQNEKEISRLQSEKEEMEIKTVISEIQSKIEDLANESHATNIESTEPNPVSEKADSANDALEPGREECLDESNMAMRSTTVDAVELGDETDLHRLTMPVIEEDEAETEATHSNTVTSLDTSTATQAESELTSLEQKIANHEYKIAELKSAVIDLTKKSSTPRTIKLHADSMHAGSMRNMHRYKFQWEYHLPYPINGISSGGQELFVSTRRTFHVFHKCSSEVTLTVDEAVVLLEENLSKMLAV